MTHAIAIDGLSGAGKSTVSRLLAQYLGIHYLDTGAMYRSLAYAAKEARINLTQEDQIKDWLPASGLEIVLDNQGQKTFIHGVDVSNLIRTPEMSRLSSEISALPPVRHYCVAKQRELANQKPLVLDGRDIGSFVLPDADFKFYLEATAEERAKRRWLQMQIDADPNTKTQSLEQVLQEIRSRDINDSNRKLAPAVAAEDAIVIDTTKLNLDQVVDRILYLMQEKANTNEITKSFWHEYLEKAQVFDYDKGKEEI
ncbi:MAG TPA: (d)CMP kinase [Clostridiaceae bacterium]|nr:(d)CMP kinase [Clostridiaceae bacterium]